MSFFELNETVVSNDFCCSCGLCVAICPRALLSMVENEYGEVVPHSVKSCERSCTLCSSVCPMFDRNPDETQLALEVFVEREGWSHHVSMGWVRDTYAGGITDPVGRMSVPSGGMTTAVLAELMRQGEIDAAIVASPQAGRPWFAMGIAETPEEVLASRGSVYHLLDFAEVLRRVMKTPSRRYAMVGPPCAIKAVRLAQRRVPALKRNIPYVLGLTCGGGRNRCFADLLVAMTGLVPKGLRYRSKTGALVANDFSFAVDSSCRSRRIKFRGLFGFVFLNAIGELKACSYCDDVFAELADATFMDAWLEEYASDPRGANLVISRHPVVSRIVERFLESGFCEGQRVAPELVEASQKAVIDKKRSGLSQRCALQSRKGWAPCKRLFALGADCGGLARSAEIGLKRWEVTRAILGNEIARLRGTQSQLGRLRAWLLCLRLYRQLRRVGGPIRNARSVFFAQRLRPRAMVRNAFRRVLAGKPTR